MRGQSQQQGGGLPSAEAPSTPDEIWNEYFRKQKRNPVEVAEAILKLQKRGEYQQVIAAIRAAIIHGQSQPWMFDVLALTMKIAGEPKEEIERVLLSRVDFSATDVPNMLYSAAYLTRFGATEQALKLYRQASTIEPTRPEPYVLGLKLAREQKDYDAVRWAATGILTSAWTKEYQQLHRDARTAAVEAEQELRRSGRSEEAEAIQAAVREAERRDLAVKLTWSGEGDIDLIVDEPAGTVCSAQNRNSRGGGVLVHDGYGPDQKNCFEEYVCAYGVPGVYRIRIRHVDGDIVGKRAQLTLTRNFGSPNETNERIFVSLSKRDRIVRLLLPSGRRTDLGPAKTPDLSGALENIRQPRRNPRGRQQPRSNSAPLARSFLDSRLRANARSGNSGFGVGYQSIVSVIPEGVEMAAMAVVSADRRYVRITTSPAISSITDVFTFSFQTTGN